MINRWNFLEERPIGFVCINYHSVESPNCEIVKTKWFQVVLLMEPTNQCNSTGPFSGEKAKSKKKTKKRPHAWKVLEIWCDQRDIAFNLKHKF